MASSIADALLAIGLIVGVGLLSSIPLSSDGVHNRLLQGELTEAGVFRPLFSFIWRYIGGLEIDLSPDGRMAITPAGGGTAILWDLSLPVEMEDVRDWIDDNRYVRELTCEERDLFRIEPLCEG